MLLSKCLTLMSLVVSSHAVAEFYVECGTASTCYNFGSGEFFAAPTKVYEFNNDFQYCITDYSVYSCSFYSTSPYYCSDVTTNVQTAFGQMTHNADYWYTSNSNGCNTRGTSGSFTGNEYYRLACGCYSNGTPDYTWKVYYFADSACTTLVGQSAWTAHGYCGSASSVTVSLFAGLAAIFAALKSM